MGHPGNRDLPIGRSLGLDICILTCSLWPQTLSCRSRYGEAFEVWRAEGEGRLAMEEARRCAHGDKELAMEILEEFAIDLI